MISGEGERHGLEYRISSAGRAGAAWAAQQFVGRLDAKAQREHGALLVHTLTFEPGFRDFDELLPQLARKLQDFATFNDCHRVVLAQATPSKVLVVLAKTLEGLSRV